MGKLVMLGLQPVPPRDGRKDLGSAQILFFTGVRYERGNLPPPPTRIDPTRPKRKRG